MIWALIGMLLAVVLAIAAGWFAEHPPTNAHASGTYAMTPQTHRIFAGISGTFALFFMGTAWRAQESAPPLLAIFVLVVILYASSFARGATGEDEQPH
jgi:hypothetical protein